MLTLRIYSVWCHGSTDCEIMKNFRFDGPVPLPSPLAAIHAFCSSYATVIECRRRSPGCAAAAAAAVVAAAAAARRRPSPWIAVGREA